MPSRLKQIAVCLTLSGFAPLSGTFSCQAESRDQLLQRTPIAEVEGQPLNTRPPVDEYSAPQMLYTPEQEDPLDQYSRSRDGEWVIPADVDRTDRWLRLLVLAPARPVLIDVAIDIQDKPFREAREAWIDRLLAEAEQTFLIRTGAATADATGVTTSLPAADEDAAAAEEQAPAEQEATVEAKAADEAGDDEAKSEELAEDDGKEAEEDDIPVVERQGRKARTLFKRLINYLAADQTTADREEVRWLLAEWTGGPAVLTTTPAFAWRRAQTAPLWHTLDSDGDQHLSSDEIANLEDSLEKADSNRDDILVLAELLNAAERSKDLKHPRSYALIVNLDQQTDWGKLLGDLQSAYSSREGLTAEMSLLDRIALGDSALKPRDLMKLFSLTADIVYRVNFGGERAKSALLAVQESAEWRFDSAKSQVITIEHPEAYMELAAAQGEVDAENASGDMQQTQVAIGGLVDGFPLFRLADQDGNRQLTLRERRQLPELLSSLDRDEDGQLDSTEIPSPIRLVVTLGPYAHQQLARPTTASRVLRDPTAEVPPWFLGMDRNRDGDLSRREFQGSPAQFAEFDRDGDGLISRQEATEKATQDSNSADE